ncbi:hypothetical protein WME99_34540 [Sorangium sp. So ce136]|uniref:hypothetical protein n=1 Tax=Sorangium sp. So ce136 TaxID=3133284 RepID=UPI003F01FB55
MAVAAVQVQERQLAALQQEITALHRELESMRQVGRSPARPAPKGERRKTGATAP